MYKHIQTLWARKKSFKVTVLCLIIPLVFIGAAPPGGLAVSRIDGRDYVSLNRMISNLKIENSFDVIYQKGRLYYRSHYLVYKIGYSSVIMDNRVVTSDYPVLRWRGGIYLPLSTALETVQSFYVNRTASVKGGKLRLADRKKLKPAGKAIKPDFRKKRRERIGFLIIDAGHGGKDPGAVGKGGLKEKVITLKLARKVTAILKKRLKGIKIKTTRNSDKFIELARRTEIANRELKRNHNGLFISIHVNASIISRISGFETYFLSQNPTNEEARKTAALENDVIILEKNYSKKKKYNDVDFVEALMMTTQIQKESSMLANSIQKSLDRKISKFKSKGVHRADFFVLRGALMPAALVEVGFITNSRESKYLQRSSYQNKISAGICDGIVNFIKSYNRSLK